MFGGRVDWPPEVWWEGEMWRVIVRAEERGRIDRRDGRRIFVVWFGGRGWL